MATQIPPQDAQRALVALGVTPRDLDAVRQAPIVRAGPLLQGLKANARRQYKRLALELHPDRTQGDEAKTEFFKLLGLVLAEFLKVSVKAAPPQRPAIHVHYYTQPATSTTQPTTWQQVRSSAWTGSGTTSTSSFTPIQVARIVKMRPK